MTSTENSGKSESLNIPIDIFAITTFICTAFYIHIYWILLNPESFLLQSFNQRVIGIGVLEGVDVVARTQFYLYSLILTGALALVLLIILENRMEKILPEALFMRERHFLTLLSLFGTANLLFGILKRYSVFSFNVSLIICLICCVLTLIVVKKYIAGKQPQNLPLFDDLALISIMVILPITGVFTLLVLLGEPFVITLPCYFIFYGGFILLLLSLVVYYPRLSPQILDKHYRGIIVNSLIPLCFYPVSIPLTNEFQYLLSRWFLVEPRILSLTFLLVLVLCSVLLLKLQKNITRPILNPDSAVDSIIFPFIVAAGALYAAYMPSASLIDLSSNNLFEHALTSTIIQQFFDFGKIPYIQIVSPHGFSDIYYAFLYSIFNGYQPLDAFLWKWITLVLIALTGFFFFREFVDGYVALLLIVFLPVLELFPPNYFFILIPAIFFVRFWKNPEVWNYFLFLCAVLFCCAWRAETGVATILAFLILSALLYYPLLKLPPSEFWKKYSRYILLTVGIMGLCLFAYIFLSIITGITPLSAVQSVVNLYSIQEARGTYPDLFISYNTQVALQYAIFPLFGLAILIYFFWVVVTRRNTVTAQFILLSFVTIGTLFLSQRSTQRHSLVEGFVWYYFPLIACSLPLLWYRTKHYTSIIFFILVFSAGFFIVGYPLTTVHGDYSQPFFEFKTWNSHENRIVIQEEDIKDTAHLTEYLRDHLEPDETYYDMSNIMMPYTLLRTEYLPKSRFHMVQTGEYYQNDTIRRLTQNIARVPIVVTGGWQTDGIPNELRTYRIAEYVYTHYRPIGKIENFEIWIRNDLDPGTFGSPDQELYRIPFVLTDLNSQDITYQIQQGEVILHAGSHDPQAWNFIFPSSNDIQPNSDNTGMHLVYRSDIDGPLQVYYSINGSHFSENNSAVGFITGGNIGRDYYVILPANLQFITNIRIDPPDNSTVVLESAYLYPQDSFLAADTTIIRDYTLKKLPYIWATFDSSDPVRKQPVQEVIFIGEEMISSNTSRLFPINASSIDKTTGNYLLMNLQSESNGTVTIVYGNNSDNRREMPGLISFDTLPSTEKQNYLMRISSQWNWYADSANYIELQTSTPIRLYECKILKGD